MKRLVFIGLCVVALVKYTVAQEQLSLRQQADNLYQRFEYFKSAQLYQKLVKKSGNDVKLLERLADCYRNINQYEEAEKWYGMAAADPKANKITHYYYAEILLRDQKLELAKQQYKLYYNNDNAGLKRKLATCDSAASWMKMPSEYSVKNHSSFNTNFSDWGLTYEGKTGLVFTSDRINDANDLDNRTGNNWFKLYEGDATGDQTRQFDVVNALGQSLNDYYHFGPIAFNNAADTAYITVTTGRPAILLPADSDSKRGQKLYTRRLQLLIARKKDNQWVLTGSFPYDNVAQYSLGDATLSKDGRIIYFTSDMPGGMGKTDIWYCEKNVNGDWSQPVNCGRTINTPEEDEFPNIGGDGALYYASKGLPGMGGYDIYKAEGAKNNWKTPENLKYPINSTSDDFYLVTRDGSSGYLSSNREGGKGSDDIYSFVLEHKPAVSSKPLAKVDTPKAKLSNPPELRPGFVLTTIYYDLDKSNIRPDAALEMDKLVALLKEKPDLKIELSSHTDSRASDQYNMALSQRRAAAAVEYLVQRGISASRLVAKYYGETRLVNQCADGVPCTEQEHQLNRRTEFRVIGGGIN
ncbi:MAG TPA: OmpA family protein [Mucilaginibacter sp.]|jgi:outer membrane protein OmpA-like peptidoglycan-associated protein|nr:OmpA family protein [Mucilaginibacter sp.]